MSLADGMGLSAADIAAVMRGNGQGQNGWGENGMWFVLLLFLFAMNGGNWGGGYGANAAVPAISSDIQRGFDQQSTQAGIGGLSAQIGAGFAESSVARCQGNADITMAITGAKDALLGALNVNQLANTQAQNNLALALQNCCCENRQAVADLKYTVAQENCADRQALNEGIRDLMAQNTANTQAIINSQNQGFQGIQDKLCQLEIDNLKQVNEQLRSQLNMAALAASQTAQTSDIINALKTTTTA